jgi:3-oxoadipate enol-lactonase
MTTTIIGSAMALVTAVAPQAQEKQMTINEVSFFTTGDGVRIAYRIEGDATKPTLVLSNSIATSMNMWDDQVNTLSKDFRVVRFDTRGHGASGVPDGGYSFERMGRDVLELLDHLKIDRVHFLGLSLGGSIGQWLAVHAPERIDKLILVNTSPYLGPAPEWDKMIRTLHQLTDMTPMADMFMKNWFPAPMREANGETVQKFRAMVMGTTPKGLAGAFAAVRDADFRRTIALIQSKTLIIGGRHDQVTKPEHSELMAKIIPGAKLIILDAVHMSNVERQEEFLKNVLMFLK